MIRRGLLVVGIATLHVIVAIGLYAARVRRSLGAGDLVVFYLPAFVAVVAYYSVLAWRRDPTHTMVAAAFGLAAASFLVGMIINLNVFGS